MEGENKVKWLGPWDLTSNQAVSSLNFFLSHKYYSLDTREVHNLKTPTVTDRK